MFSSTNFRIRTSRNYKGRLIMFKCFGVVCMLLLSAKLVAGEFSTYRHSGPVSQSNLLEPGEAYAVSFKMDGSFDPKDDRELFSYGKELQFSAWSAVERLEGNDELVKFATKIIAFNATEINRYSYYSISLFTKNGELVCSENGDTGRIYTHAAHSFSAPLVVSCYMTKTEYNDIGTFSFYALMTDKELLSH